ncbi:hypothetical protein Acr_00g0053200 [Actinidia rufa]|uniref:Uncharacterized protein n=1 Tax=Actinidia rufa TaxID=165716 RepID=A0A7J0DLF3_9ERIC|nr:hypothetical protein Acr_00g0053200 [Actinidia rufa]
MAELRWLREKTKGQNTGSSGGSSSTSSIGFSSNEEEVKEREEVNQGEVPVPTAVHPLLQLRLISYWWGGPESSSKEMGMVPKPRAIGQKKLKAILLSKLRWGGVGSSIGTLTPAQIAELWNPGFTVAELGKKSIQREMANSKRMNKHCFKLNKVQKRANTLEGDLKKVKEKLAIEESSRKASDNASQEKLNKAIHYLAELQLVATGPMYERGT